MAHRDARKLIAIGTLLVVAAVVGGYVYPGLIIRVDAVRGTISQARFLTGDGTLAEPKPLIYVWVGVGIFGLAWIVLGWLMGRPATKR